MEERKDGGSGLAGMQKVLVVPFWDSVSWSAFFRGE
jgi:hypothetical protein